MRSSARVVAACAVLLLAAQPATAADCGDKAGPGGTDVPCSCGDTLVTDVRLGPEDPVVFHGDADTPCAGTGLVAGADGVRLDCLDNRLRGNGTGTGIQASGFDGLEIEDCHVYDFENGIEVSDAMRLEISDCSVFYAAADGIALESCERARLRGNWVVEAQGSGILLRSSQRNALRENDTSFCRNGIVLEQSRDNLIARNAPHTSDEDNLRLDGATQNVFKDNGFHGAGGAGIRVLDAASWGNSFRKNYARGNGELDITNGSEAGQNEFQRNFCDTASGPDVDCP